MVNCDNCAYQSFCYGVNKEYCPRYTPAMITYDDKIPNTNVTYYSMTDKV